MPHPVAETYHEIVRILPENRRIDAERLPFAIGVADRVDGGFEDYSQKAPLYDMPLFVIEDEVSCGSAFSPALMAEFRRAHHCAGFYGLLADRLADGQAEENETTLALLDHFRKCWVNSLAKAASLTEPAADNIVSSAICDLKRGIKLERSFLKPGALDCQTYTKTICLNVSWLLTTTICLLKTLGQPERIPPFKHLYHVIMCGLQLRDDARDVAEDRILNGVSYPEALGYSPGSLFLAGGRLMKTACSEAAEAGFFKLAQWLNQHPTDIFSVEIEIQPEIDAIGAWIIASEILNELDKLKNEDFIAL